MKGKHPTLKAQNRDKLGTRYAQRDRQAGLLPANLYGHGVAPVAINLHAKEAISFFEAGEKVFKLDFPGDKHKDENQMVLLKELQFDYLGDSIVHADLARVSATERVRTRVHVDLKGEAKGLKSAGAILMHPTSELEIECRVVDLPDSIVVDISDLELDGMVTASQVKLPSADMKLITDGHAIVAQIVEAKEEVVAEAAVVGAEAAQPEVIGEKERAEKAAAAGTAGDKKGAAPAAGAKAAAPAAAKAAAPKK